MSTSSYEESVVETLRVLAEALLKRTEPQPEPQPFAAAPDLLHVKDIREITGWSSNHVYNVMKRPDFKLANGGQEPKCCFKTDFINWLRREVP